MQNICYKSWTRTTKEYIEIPTYINIRNYLHNSIYNVMRFIFSWAYSTSFLSLHISRIISAFLRRNSCSLTLCDHRWCWKNTQRGLGTVNFLKLFLELTRIYTSYCKERCIWLPGEKIKVRQDNILKKNSSGWRKLLEVKEVPDKIDIYRTHCTSQDNSISPLRIVNSLVKKEKNFHLVLCGLVYTQT